MGWPLATYLRIGTGLLFCACCASQALAGSAPEGAALVNGSLITRDTFQNELKRVERLTLRGKGPAGGTVKKKVLDDLIVRELLYQEAVRLGVQVGADEVTAEIAQLRKKLPADGALERNLDRLGFTAADLESQLERGMTVRRFLERAFAGKVSVSEAEAARYYDEHQDEFQDPLRLRISHILVQIDPSWDAQRRGEGRARIEAARKRIHAGDEFARVARESSECSSAGKGGDLGYFKPGELSKKIEDEARALQLGEVSGVVEDRFGLHLLQLTELRPASVLPLEQVRGRIQAKLGEEKQVKLLIPLVKRLRAAAKVEIILNGDEP
jgi:peptidyl-prolyl cis-trans isomerase C